MFGKITRKIPEELKVIFEHIQDKRLFYFAVASALFSSGLTASIPYVYGKLTDLAISGASQWRTIVVFLLFWLLLAFFNDFIGRKVDRASAFLAMDAQNSFSLWLISHLIDLPVAFHKEKKSGAILSKIQRGGDSIFNFLDSAAFNIFPKFISLFIAFFVILSVEWRIALLIILMCSFYVFVTLKYIKIIITEDKKRHRFWDKVFGDAYDGILNILSVKAFTNEEFEKKKNRKNYHRAGSSFKGVMKHYLRLNFWQQSIFNLGFVGIFGVGLMILKEGKLSIGDFIMFIGYFNLITSPIAYLGNQYRFIRRMFISINRALKILKYKPETDYPFAKNIGTIKGEVVFRNVFFKYKKGGEILKNISFSVSPGEAAALVGESGVGKSTLANLISRYYLPAKGKIFIDGKEIRQITINSLRRQIAFVPQEVALFNDTVKNNIAYGKIGAPDEEIIAAAKAASADEFIEKFPKKYETIVGERGVKLSVGQKQRIAIARAILRDPRILILDEATAALDSVSEKLVQEALRKLIKGRTVFVIAHRLSTIVNVDKIIVLENGEIAETGRHEDLIKQEGVYKKFWELQTRVEEEKLSRLLNGMVELSETE